MNRTPQHTPGSRLPRFIVSMILNHNSQVDRQYYHTLRSKATIGQSPPESERSPGAQRSGRWGQAMASGRIDYHSPLVTHRWRIIARPADEVPSFAPPSSRGDPRQQVPGHPNADPQMALATATCPRQWPPTAQPRHRRARDHPRRQLRPAQHPQDPRPPHRPRHARRCRRHRRLLLPGTPVGGCSRSPDRRGHRATIQPPIHPNQAPAVPVRPGSRTESSPPCGCL